MWARIVIHVLRNRSSISQFYRFLPFAGVMINGGGGGAGGEGNDGGKHDQMMTGLRVFLKKKLPPQRGSNKVCCISGVERCMCLTNWFRHP